MTGGWGGQVRFGGAGNACVAAARSGFFVGQCHWMCPCCLQRWHRPLRRSSSELVDCRRIGMVYILSISIRTEEPGDGGVGKYSFTGKGE